MTELGDAVQQALEEIVAPLQEQLGTIERRIAELEVELMDARAARVKIRSVLDRINPPAPKPKTSTPDPVADGNRLRAERQLEEKVEALAAWLPEHVGEISEDGSFTGNRLVAFQQGKDIVPGGLSSDTAARVLDRLAERGVVRRDKIVRGGGMQWKVNGR